MLRHQEDLPVPTITKAASTAGVTLLLAMGFSAPAAAQDDSGGEAVNQLIIYGDDACPPSTSDQITVCARKDEAERYRIPEALRGAEDPRNEAWSNRVLTYEAVLDSGTLSCSPAGAGGWTGCTQQMIDQAYAEKRTDTSVRFSELIAQARAERLSSIDSEAAAMQARVEEAERARVEKEIAEEEAARGQ